MSVLTLLIMLAAEVCCTDRSTDEERVVIGSGDGSIVLYDTQRKITQITKTELVSNHLFLLL